MKFNSSIDYLLMLFAFIGQIATGSAQVRVEKNINYAGNADGSNTLNIYHPKNLVQQHDVLVFIHGGSWSSGKKETYWWLGRNLAKKNVVAVVINYPLAPNATYREMALASATAVKWVRANISTYGGDADRIFLMGHSAGAHLAELVNADPQYFKAVGMVNPVKGVILNDPFGLDMHEYLTQSKKDDYYTDFLRTFSNDPKVWELGSPLSYVQQIKNPHLIFYGTETYEAIKIQSERLYQKLKAENVPVKLEVIEGKKHVAMVSQLIWSKNPLYTEIFNFLNTAK
jgi:acetyl esterase/lipase